MIEEEPFPTPQPFDAIVRLSALLPALASHDRTILAAACAERCVGYPSVIVLDGSGVSHLPAEHVRPLVAALLDQAAIRGSRRLILRHCSRPVRSLLADLLDQLSKLTLKPRSKSSPGEWRRYRLPQPSARTTQRRNARVRSLARRDGCRCVWCGCQLDPLIQPATLDHVRPKSREGSMAVANLVLACEPCNHRRGNIRTARWLKHCQARGMHVDLHAVQMAEARLASPATRLPIAS
jgi:5-methylcytosine-specific restriction endonuclease McrA